MKKLTTGYIIAQNTFLMQHHLVLSTWNTFLCHISTFLCNVKLFISTQNYFSCNTKFLFCTSFGMLCLDDILLLSHSNKNIFTCEKINKLSFLCDTKKLISFFLRHHFFIFSFYITHCQHVDLLRSETKKLFNHLLLTCLIYTEAAPKWELPKKGFLLFR